MSEDRVATTTTVMRLLEMKEGGGLTDGDRSADDLASVLRVCLLHSHRRMESTDGGDDLSSDKETSSAAGDRSQNS